jgi:class 3 adenylate cyclase
MFPMWVRGMPIAKQRFVNTFQRIRKNRGRPRVEAGTNTSTVTLRVGGDEEKGSLESETVKYGRESQGIGTRE